MSQPAGVTDNRTIMAKADLALADLTSDGGLLQPVQAAKFMRLMIKASKVLGVATVTPMKSPIQLIEKIRFNGRILHAGAEGQALPAADRSKPNLSKVSLSAKLFKGEVRLSNETLEDSIERGDLRQTIMELMAEAVARDTEEVVVQGDATSADPFLAEFDGMLKAAVTHVVDVAAATTNKTQFRDMLKAMPSEFQRNKKQLQYFTSVNSEIMYRDGLSSRLGGDLSDRALEQDVSCAYGGVPIMDVPLFPETIGTGAACTDHILTDPKNLNVGIWRNIRIETDKLISEGSLLIVVTLRMDFKYAEETAVVKAINVRVG